ncbi:hypothetical protein Hypma_002962 [Hypsizygus marmoreus]|uniref:Uncharacterized protein n=1 Tax=Hypsizygus marmoreus TaxID=39966 RepID=A0A369J2Y6_HYPMA|nr:hypothetical protein Hypma_002962 [Hypsizygus marmoreus]
MQHKLFSSSPLSASNPLGSNTSTSVPIPICSPAVGQVISKIWEVWICCCGTQNAIIGSYVKHDWSMTLCC